MVADSDKCFRVSGIPGDYTECQIGALLTRELHLDDDALQVFSLARNPLRQSELIATLSFSQIPSELSERGQKHIDIPPTSPESRGPRRQVVLDSHFEGFTPLHTTKDDECYMDVVALSGLNGHAFGSFKAKGGSHMWLRDALPLDLPKARIFIYGYDTSPHNVSFQNIWDLESTFRQKLRMLRARSNPKRKPFVIIAHSLGGIIAKAAVIKMAESAINGDDAVYQSLRGILLFGVPSQGMDIESLIPMVPVSEMRALLSSLDKSNSPTLRELGERFPRKIKALQNFEAFNFYETKESPTATRNDEGNWEMRGPPTILVTPFSATQGRLENEPGHRVIALNRTHSEMIKFNGANDNDYETTLDCLKEIEDHIARASNVWPLQEPSKDEQECLQSLSFLEQHSREFDPKIYAAEGTCTWIREHPNYSSWLTTNSGLLWIMGPPGAGKSTLMKFLVKEKQEYRLNREIIAVFFVYGRGSEKQKSPIGVYQSLLHQILPHCPGPLASLAKAYTEYTITRGNCGYRWNWEEEELRDFLISTLLSESCQRPITVFIDALDEMGEGPAVKLIANLARLHNKDVPQSSRLKLCFSCRYYPNLVEERSLSVAVEKENWRDIDFLIETHTALTKFGHSDRATITELMITRANGIFQWVSIVLDEVIHLRRRGQPATAVIARIKEVPGTLRGIYDALLVFENEHDREQTLKFFQWILFSLKPMTLDDLRQALAIDANMPHNTLEEIMQNHCYYQLEDMPTVVQDLSKGLARVIEDPSIGGKYIGYVGTIHQSVNDYLLQSGLKDLAQPLTGDPEGLAHFQISRSCIGLLRVILQSSSSLMSQNGYSDEDEILVVGEKEERSDEDEILVIEEQNRRSDILMHWNNNIPLAAYAQTLWLEHVIKVEKYKIDQQDLLETLPWRKHCGTLAFIFTESWSKESWFNPHREVIDMVERLAGIFWHDFSYLWDPVHLLALAGIHSALEKMEHVEPDIYSRMDLFGQTTLLFALAGRNERIVASAMNISAQNHVRNDESVMSPLYLAVIHRREDWVQAIISKGADLDQMNRAEPGYKPGRYSALYQAYGQKDEKMVRLLLSAGADPSAVCINASQRVTVIHQAVVSETEWSERMLPLLVESAIKLYPTKKLPNLKGWNHDYSTLFYAIERENVPLVQLLLDSGARQDRLGDAQTDDTMVFRNAAARGLLGMVKVLLDNGLSPSTISSRMSLLHIAAFNRHPSVARLLLDAGARPTGLGLDNEDEYPFLVCSVDPAPGHEKGLDIHPASDGDDRMVLHSSENSSYDAVTPLELAVENGYASVVQVFLDVINTREVGTKAKVGEIQGLPWNWYIQLAVQHNFPDVVQVLLKSGVDPNTFASGQIPLLHVAIGKGSAELARMLLHHGADPTLTDVSGVTALHRAVGSNHLEMMRMLLDWKDDHGRTLIMLEIFTSEQIAWLPLSARRDRPSWVIQQVLRTEYNLNVKDNKGLTALSYAVVENMPEIVDALLDHGRSDPNTQSLQGDTPLMRAASAGYETILQRLLACPLTDIAIEDEDGLTALDHARMAGNRTGVALLRKKQDELLAQRQNTLAIKTLERGRAWLLHTGVTISMMGTLRRRPY